MAMGPLANAAVRQQTVLRLWRRTRGTSTSAVLGDWTETYTVLQLFYLQTSLKIVTMFHINFKILEQGIQHIHDVSGLNTSL